MGHMPRRQMTTAFLSTCGYENGDANQPRTANGGYDCTFWSEYALWGFCPQTVDTASDCGLAGNCIDAHGCSTGCGIHGISSLTTFTCTKSGSDYCSTALLTDALDRVYAYLACASAPITDHLFVEAITTSATQSSSTDSSSTTPVPSYSSLSSSSLPIFPDTTTNSASVPTTAPTPASVPTTAPTPAPVSATAPAVSSNSPNNIGGIIGGVLGGLALIFIFVLALVYLRRSGRADRGSTLLDSAIPLQSSQASWIHNPDFPSKNNDNCNGEPIVYSSQKRGDLAELGSYKEPQEFP